jgi:hypothetical protein
MAFAREMESRMRANSHKSGWETCRPTWCLKRALEEIGEAYDVIGQPLSFTSECADAANFLMFAATNHSKNRGQGTGD